MARRYTHPSMATKDAHARAIVKLAEEIARLRWSDPDVAAEQAPALALTALSLWDDRNFRAVFLCLLGAIREHDRDGIRSCTVLIRRRCVQQLRAYDRVVAEETASQRGVPCVD